MIKAIAVDMDGTFLKSTNDYSRERFEKIYQELQEKDIKFIVASGNQYAQLSSFFPNQSEITFVSENGALIFEKNQLLKKATFDSITVHSVLRFLLQLDVSIGIVLCGAKQAYMLEKQPEAFQQFANRYYYALAEVASFDNLPEDEFVKIALQVPEREAKSLVDQLNQHFSKDITAVVSGHDSVDLLIPSVNKGQALLYLLKRWQISASQLLAFGDSNNDLEMLKLAEFSYAMANGSEEVLQTARYVAPSNDDEGVLTVIETWLAKMSGIT
ncbi:Cof-type HAD-IIB family hydrolase [Candidatus Enterococcus willemsii]|uniref:Hydrolase n=1 Tax=Candidatus Enterococcus willemsii TaxID=1857215 RepID=A0ABQ6YXN0_9ENTE|nr:Cof-type HAD-IIB family hydrolase [Enterococcus sp. CU12B]KAF1302736.1 hydrolase [Enterococcus sp. CU12B]